MSLGLLGVRQLKALIGAAVRELVWGLPAVAYEVRCLKSRAAAIPDAALREDALIALAAKRNNIDGAALFWILPANRCRSLLRLLASYEAMADFLDSTNERAAACGTANGQQLHRALLDALDPEGEEECDYYRYHPWREDAGYLRAVIRTCRASCESLPGYHTVRPKALRAAGLVSVQALNHVPDADQRETALKEWAADESRQTEAQWFERTASASAWITVLALLASAADPECDESRVEVISSSYFWISLVAAMLDSYSDQSEDLANSGHSYFAYYATQQAAIERVGELLRRSTQEARALPNGYRHAVITASMIAMYLSKDSVLARPMRTETCRLVRAAGPLTAGLLPLLRGWRILYSLRSA